MVQVDALWSFGIGAGVAVTHHHQLKAAFARGQAATQTAPYQALLLLLGALFEPSGIYLLWAFPSWETMHVLDRSMPAWAVALFAATNVTQGVLGFWLTARLLRANRALGAGLVWAFGYVGMFFVLMHGWDGTGYQRFFSNTPEELATWQWSHASRWFTGDVAVALYVMGVVLVPALVWPMAAALRETRQHHVAVLVAAALGVQVVVFPLVALMLSLLLHGLGNVVGVGAGALLVALLVSRRGPLRAVLLFFAQEPGVVMRQAARPSTLDPAGLPA